MSHAGSEWRDLLEKAIYNRRTVPAVARQAGRNDPADRKGKGKMRLIKAILVLVVLGLLGVIGYAYLGDLTPEARGMSTPVTLPGAENAD